MSTRHIAAESAHLSDLTPEGSSGRASKRFRHKLAADGFTVDEGFRLKPGYLYTVVRAISARVNQNYDGWPSEELKKSYKTFIGKPVFVNHENHDPTKARGVVVAARYVENGMDKYVEVVQEIDAQRFPKLAHEIKTGGLDSVSMGAEAGFTICSYCHNKATDLDDMCDHVINHKGKTLTRFDKRTGKKEDVLVFESCHKISFFELSYVFEPADETAVASKVVVAATSRPETPAQSPSWNRPRNKTLNDTKRRWAPEVESGEGSEPLEDERDPFDPRSFTASEDVTVPAPPGAQTIDQSVIDATPVIELTPATELTGHEAPGLAKSSAFDTDIAEITKMAGQCPPGQDCNKMPDPVKELSSGGGSSSGGTSSLGKTPGTGSGGGDDTGGTLKPETQKLQDSLKSLFPGSEIGGYRPPDGYNEHSSGSALDFMTTDHAQAKSVMDHAFANGANYVIWDQKQWNPDGTTSVMEDRGSPTQNHKDHVHINIGKVAGKYTKDDFNHPSGKMPWERDTDSDAEDAAAIEIEAMMLHTAMPYAPETQSTQRGNTFATNLHAEKFLDEQGAPRGRHLDFGAGYGRTGASPDLPPDRAGLGYETFEPNPHPSRFIDRDTGMPGGVDPETGEPKAMPDHTETKKLKDGTFHRIQSANVLNVLRPGEELGQRHHAVREIGRLLAPGGHAVITTRSWKGDVERHAPVEGPEPISEPNAIWTGRNPVRYQKGFDRHELAEYVQGVLGDGYTVNPVKIGSATAIHIIKHDAPPSRKRVRNVALKKIARQRALKLAWGETEAPMTVDTLREEGSAPEDDDDDFEQYVKSPKDLQTPDLSEAQQIDREQELAGATPDQMGGVPGAADPMAGAAPQQPQQQYMTLQIPIPPEAPQVPQQAAPPVMAQPPMPAEDPSQQQPPPITASVLDYFDRYYGRRVANWLDAIEARRDMTPAEAADYRRQAVKLSTLENGQEHSTTDRNPRKEPADMARNTIASRSKVARAGRRQHLAEGPYTDGPVRGRNDEGENEEAFISQVPPAEPGDFVTDEGHISNTEHNLVARVQQGREQLLRDASQLAALQKRRALTESGGPTAEIVDPTVHTGPEGEALTGDNFVSADPNDGVTPTNPKDASLRAFQAFDGWLAQKTGKSSRRHTEANIKKAAAAFSREAGISPQMLFPALGIVLREARKNDKKKANTKGAAMRKRADEKLEVAAPDGRVDVEAPVENVTSAEAQASQFDIHDFGQNAGDSVAKPDLSTDQNWAPGEASGQKAAAVKTAGGLLAMRCAEGMIAAGLEPNDRERKYQLAAEFENMNRGLIQDRVALLERFAAVRQADLRKVASGSSRGAARSPIPAGLGGGTRTAAAGQRVAAHDPSNDSSLFI